MKKIPAEIKNFKEMIDNDYYYVDKSMFIKDVLKERIAFYHRFHGFGRTLNLSMLQYFFSIKEKDNAYLFDGLAISKDEEAIKYPNKYPVLYMSLKGMSDFVQRGLYSFSFWYQSHMFKMVLSELILQYPELFESMYLEDYEKKILNLYKEGNYSSKEFGYNLKSQRDATLFYSLYNIVLYVYKHYHQRVIVLIDDYDIPIHYNNFFKILMKQRILLFLFLKRY